MRWGDTCDANKSRILEGWLIIQSVEGFKRVHREKESRKNH